MSGDWQPAVVTHTFRSGRTADVLRDPNVFDLVAGGALGEGVDTTTAQAHVFKEVVRAMLVRPVLVDDPADVCFEPGKEAILFGHLTTDETLELIQLWNGGLADAEQFRDDTDRAGGSDGSDGVGDDAEQGGGAAPRRPARTRTR